MISQILDRLEGVKRSGQGYLTKCPAHADKSPSLSLTELNDGRILIHCHAGCSPSDVLMSIGLALSDLYPDGGLGHYRGFMQIQADQQARTKDRHYGDELILEVAKSDRKAGKRLSEKDLAIEKQAFLRIRGRNHANP